VLGLSEFDTDIFKAKIAQIIVPKDKTLEFHFMGGKTVTREWKSTAASDCWTPERRAAQGRRMKGKEVSEETRQKRRVATTAHYAAHPERRIADSERMKKFCAENPEWGKAQNERMIACIAKNKSKREGETETL
jgi:hypothetical protein